MILKGRAIDQLTGGGAGKYRAVLFYGPDEGRVRESALLAARSICEDLSDPFRVVGLDGVEIRADPARLADEAAAISMTGGRRVLRLRNIGDAVASIFAEFLKNPAGDSVIIAEAGELSKTSKLRKLFETSPVCAIAACYEDNPEDLAALITRHLHQNHLTITLDARDYLQSCLGEDRLATRQELDKLVLYMGPSAETDKASTEAYGDFAGVQGGAAVKDAVAIKDISDIQAVPEIKDIHDIRDGRDILGVTGGGDSADSRDVRDISAVREPNSLANRQSLTRQITLKDVTACIGDHSTQNFDDICDAMAMGDLAALDYRLTRAFEATLSSIAILRSVSNHLIQLHVTLGRMAQGSPADQVIRLVRPPLHFSRLTDFRHQLRIWDLPRLTQALDIVLKAESLCKSSLAAENMICNHALQQVALLARQNLKGSAFSSNSRNRH